ncbi:T9SS type A sorting domain-containing protein [Hymenobacter sp.]|uniref:T9SS type A sorting domain-containing protein n=1 Tax=Hymenobacter sp. TaxID=1898978 RepID=UPI002ED7BB81
MQRQDSASGLMEIRFEPNKLQKFYAGVLDSLPVYHLESSLAHLHTTISTPPTPPTQYRAEPLFCRMYPNPAADILTLQPANDGLYEVTILDMLAKPVQVGSVSKGIATVRVQHLPVGRYVVWVREETTGRVTKQQLLIER